MTVKLQKLYRFQTLRLLDAINREDVDNQFWTVSSYKDNWSLADVFGSESDTVFEMGDYITVMYDNENWFPAYTENRDICKFPHYDASVEDDLRVLIFKI